MFKETRLRLTAWYLLIIMFISISFSAIIHQALIGEVDRFARAQRFRIEHQFDPAAPQEFINPEFIEEIKTRITLVLIIVNGGILFVSGVLGYFLAGRTLKPIKDMLDEQNRFISDSSHELRTPLTSLKSAMEVALRDKHLTLEEAKILISENIDDVNKLQYLSDKLLQLAQYQKQNVVRNLEKTPVELLISSALKKVASMAKKNNITIENQVPELSLYCDPVEITDLLVILLDNAIKYSPKGGKVILKGKKSRHNLMITVEDQGIGIAEKDLPHIFDRFYRSDTARKKSNTGGYGLGLAIAQKIVTNYHGTITVSSRLGKGSLFTFRLPL